MNTTINTLNTFAPTPRMPILFVGHGNPMNAITENPFVTGFRDMAKDLPRPTAILCISAHWETHGTQVTAMEHPPTIHDFGGFPPELFAVEYPAPGSPELAQQTKATVKTTDITLDTSWGLDHGAWSVIKHFYPKADIPVVELSLDRTQKPDYHYQLGQELAALRNKGVLIIGSGNMVHNLRMVDWRKLDTNFGFDWALETRAKMKEYIQNGDHKALIDFRSQGRGFELAIPTPEHYLPLLYILGLQTKDEKIEFFNDEPVGGSLTMTSLKIN